MKFEIYQSFNNIMQKSCLKYMGQSTYIVLIYKILVCVVNFEWWACATTKAVCLKLDEMKCEVVFTFNQINKLIIISGSLWGTEQALMDYP